MRHSAEEKVVNIVRRNSGDMQPEAVSEHVILQLACGEFAPETVNDALESAVEKGRLERTASGYTHTG